MANTELQQDQFPEGMIRATAKEKLSDYAFMANTFEDRIVWGSQELGMVEVKPYDPNVRVRNLVLGSELTIGTASLASQENKIESVTESENTTGI